eukprot:scaffold281839_cov26-Tisochrysis_lutea.AAC.1
MHGLAGLLPPSKSCGDPVGMFEVFRGKEAAAMVEGAAALAMESIMAQGVRTDVDEAPFHTVQDIYEGVWTNVDGDVWQRRGSQACLRTPCINVDGASQG